MAEYLQRFLGGAKSSISSVSTEIDNDFADFATAASPVAPSHAATPAASPTGGPSSGLFSAPFSSADRPFTKWYRVWERVTIKDFYQELVLLPILFIFILLHLWGSRTNRLKAKQWAASHLPLLESEFAQVGFNKSRRSPKIDEGSDVSALAKATVGTTDVPDDLLKELSKQTYITYATGRQNVAGLDIRITLYPRYNPGKWLAELLLSFFIDSVQAPAERLEATLHCFDGKEKLLVPGQSGQGSKDSSYDGFVWAVVHKDRMKELRDDRYDLSLTATKDHPKLPIWATVMSESAEVTEALLTPELIKAITDTGEDLEALIITDQPIDAPKKLNDTIPSKRISLAMRLSTPSPNSTSLFATFLRLPDFLVNTAHFRPEALRKIRATREEEQRKIRKIDEEEKAEERRTQGDKMKKEERERKLRGMSAEEQRKFLEKEREREGKKGMKKRSMKA